MSKRNMGFTILQPVTIPRGTIFKMGPSSITFGEPHYIVNLGIGDNHTATLIVGESAIRDHPQLFTELKDGLDILKQ